MSVVGNLFGVPRPAVVGHRGASVLAPENTPAAFAAAARAGASWVELDARRSADGMVVVHHDAWLPDEVAVLDLSVDALRQRGVWTLDEVLAGLPEGLGVDVEVKNFPGEPDYDEGHTVVDILARLLGGHRRPVLTSSFNPLTVAALTERLPDVPAALLTGDALRPDAGLGLARELGCAGWFPHVDTPQLDGHAVLAAHEAGLGVMVWTVEDPDQARRLAGAGVDALCTDDPARLVAALGGGGP